MHRRALSIIELLVVIAVVAVLLSLALPALQSARHSARSIAGVARMRSLAHGLIADAQSGRDAWLNPFSRSTQPPPGSAWTDAGGAWPFDTADALTPTEYFALYWASFVDRSSSPIPRDAMVSPADAPLSALRRSAPAPSNNAGLFPSSFLYSPTFWCESERYLDGARFVMTRSMLRTQTISGVIFPASKALLWERADFRHKHRAGSRDIAANAPPAWNNPASKIHAASCDGSVRLIDMLALMSRSTHANLCGENSDASLVPGGTILTPDNPTILPARGAGGGGPGLFPTDFASDAEGPAFFWATQKGVRGRDW